MDDGPATLEESLAMLALAAKSGTTDLVATPHASLRFSFQPDQIRARLAELESAGTGVRLHTGCDFHLAYDNLRHALADPNRYTINGKCYLLVEFPDLTIYASTEEIFGQLLRAGMTPIITHPERNMLLWQRLPEIQRWVRNGCLLQVTALSVLGAFGRKPKSFADELLRHGLVHFIASDAHDPVKRTPDLSPAYHYVAEEYGEAMARALFVENPTAVLTGEPLPVPAPHPDVRRRKWRLFWK